MDDDQTGQPSGQSGTGPDRTRTLGERMKLLLLALMPKRVRDVIQDLVDQRLLRDLALVVALVFLAPPLVTGLAAFWLLKAGNSDYAVVRDARNHFVGMLQQGFGIKDEIRKELLESHSRLDYLQIIEKDLSRESSKLRIPLNLAVGQNAELRLEVVKLVLQEGGPACSLDESLALVRIKLGETVLKTIEEDLYKEIIRIDNAWWRENASRWTSGLSPQELSFSLPTETLRSLSCGKVHIAGSLSVLKVVADQSAMR